MGVLLANEQADEVDTVELRQIAETVLREEGFPDDTEVAIVLVSDDEIADYNARYLGGEGPTDVLSFPIEPLTPGVVPDRDPAGPPLVIGDVLIAPSYVRRAADEMGVSFEDEMALMTAHGILHLMGYDHEEDDEATVMEDRERQLLAMVGRKRR
ncbi:MAG: rRNA maturation RNase YbeY [Acidimicrobiales bacterium]|nr:rRNA maturation RNase YbeY [Acidimicrobiales bacterium]